MAGLVGSIIGSGQQSSADSSATQQQLQALQNILNLQTPTVAEEQLNPENEQSVGQLTPEMEEALKEQNTGLSNVSVNPALRSAQLQALQSLQQQGQTGLSASDRQALSQISQQEAQQANSQNQAVLQNAASRGEGGSGASLAAQLANNQNSANSAMNRDMSIASQAQQNALNATAQSGQLGNQMENSQYGEASNAARAQDAINQFNTANAQNVANTNVMAQNQAQGYNLQNAQNISNYNTGMSNQAQQYNKQLYQQNYEDQLQQQQAAAGQANNYAGNEMKAGQNSYNDTMGIANQAGNAASSIGGYISGLGGEGADDEEEDNQGGFVGQKYADGGLVQQAAHLAPLAAMFMSKGGMVPQGYASGGYINTPIRQAHIASPKPVNFQAPQEKMVSEKPIHLFSMVGRGNYADGGVVQGNGDLSPSARQQIMASLAKTFAPKQAAPQQAYAPGQFPNAEDAAANGQAETLTPAEQAQVAATNAALAKFNAARGQPGMGQPGQPTNYMSGGKVKGPNIVPGDSPANDVVSAKLSGGELVIPKSVVNSNNDDVIMAFIKGAMSGKRGK